MDNHRALQGLLRSPTGATPWAPWNLIRPTFEAAFYALWLLEPDLGKLRRQRALRLELIDQKERLNFLNELGHIPGKDGRKVREAAAERSVEVNQAYRQEALRLGVDWSHAGDAINVRDEVGKLKAVKTEPAVDSAVYFRSMWRSLSGYQHGRGYAMLANSNITVLAPITGSSQMRV